MANTLNIMPFLQRWDGEQLTLNVALLPKGNPVDTGFYWNGAPFAGTVPKLFCHLQAGIDSFDRNSVRTVPVPVALTPPASSAETLAAWMEVKERLETTLNVKLRDDSAVTRRPPPDMVKKALPASYLKAVAAPPRRPDLVLDEREYGCRLRQTPTSPPQSPDDESMTMTWGKVISYALMQPALCKRLGLVYYKLTIGEDAFQSALASKGLAQTSLAEWLTNGGWLATELDTSTDSGTALAGNSAGLLFRTYVPPLKANQARQLFSAILFPETVPKTADGEGLDEALQAAAEFDDGFASIVHAAHPNVADVATEQDKPMTPGAEAGIRLGWDDEHILAWQDHLLRSYKKVQEKTKDPDAEAVPSFTVGVSAYRIDVRAVGGATEPGPGQSVGDATEPGPGQWASLCVARPNAAKAGPKAVAVDGPMEFGVSVAPLRPMVDGAPLTLPRYFATWRGGSLAGPDSIARWLATWSGWKLPKPLESPVPPDEPAPMAWLPVTEPVEQTEGGVSVIVSGAVPPLRYGHTYEFRVRYRDLTGGGPATNEEPINPAIAPKARIITFQRTVRPKAFSVIAEGPQLLPQGGEAAEVATAPSLIRLQDPLLGYPEFTYASTLTAVQEQERIKVEQAKFVARALADQKAVFGVPDPDVTHIAIALQVRAVQGDSGNARARDGEFIEIERHVFKRPAGALQFAVQYAESSNVFAGEFNTSEGLESLSLVVPMARDVRLIFWPVCSVNERMAGYFDASLPEPGTFNECVFGLPSYAYVRQEEPMAALPVNVLADGGLSATAMLIGNDAEDPLQLIASTLGLDLPRGRGQGLCLCGRAGDRVVFGASDRLRHTLADGNGRIQFASLDELRGHWVVAVETEWRYDWTWDGLKQNSFTLFHSHASASGEAVAETAERQAGTLSMPLAVDEAQCGARPDSDRCCTKLVFFDAVPLCAVDATDQVPASSFAQAERWRLVANPKLSAPATAELATETQELKLPIAVPPAPIPKVTAAGIAHGQPEPDCSYAALEAAPKSLWLEFEQALPYASSRPNFGLKYFVRVLGNGPDPLITPLTWMSPADRDEPKIDLDPEPIRVIRAGQPHDEAGYPAMQEMVPEEVTSQNGADPKIKRWLLPLPPGLTPESPQLFDFWTYEIRVGFDLEMWTTAQARFGRPMRLVGVQHPAPPLEAVAFRETRARTWMTIRPDIVLPNTPEAIAAVLEKYSQDASQGTARAPALDELVRGSPALYIDTMHDALTHAISLGPEDRQEVASEWRDIVVQAPFAYSVGPDGPMTYERIHLGIGVRRPRLTAHAITDVPPRVLLREPLAAMRIPVLPRTDLWALLFAQVRQTDNTRNRNVLLLKTCLGFAGDLKRSAHYIEEWYGQGVFADQEVRQALQSIGLKPETGNLSVLVVELLPNAKANEDGSKLSDPLGAQLGSKRILRTSGLIPVAYACVKDAA